MESVRNIANMYLLNYSPRRQYCKKHDFDPTRVRRANNLDRMSTTSAKAENDEVEIIKRLDNTIQFRGRLVDEILFHLGVQERPHSRNVYADVVYVKQLFARLDVQVFQSLQRQHHVLFLESEQARFYFRVKYIIATKKPTEDNFESIRTLGRGGFGKVTACRSVTTGKLYALKVINKRRAKFKNAENMCIIERQMLARIRSPFIMSLKYAFSDVDNLFLVLDLMIGGDLGFHLRSGTFTMQQAKFYTARLVSALGVLHQNAYIYRDLKPENILLDSKGYSKLSDFGLTCQVGEKGYVSGVCGTRGYWAPEMHRYRIDEFTSSDTRSPMAAYSSANNTRQNHQTGDGDNSHTKKIKPVYSYSADWFSLGCCIFEFLSGVSPFRTDRAKHWCDGAHNLTATSTSTKKQEIEKNLDLALQEMDADLNLLKPSESNREDYKRMDEELDLVKDLLKKLLQKNPKMRTGSGGSRYGRNPRGFEEIQQHPWFAEIDWDTLHLMTPSFEPASNHSNAVMGSEIGDFNDEKLINKNVKGLEDIDHTLYKDWDFVDESSAQQEIVELLHYQEQDKVSSTVTNML